MLLKKIIWILVLVWALPFVFADSLSYYNGTFFEPFVNLTYGNWYNEGTGNNWTIVSSECLYDNCTRCEPAGLKYLVMNISLSSYKNINISYWRRDWGLDPGEYCGFDYYNGTSWVELDNAILGYTFVNRNYSLPSVVNNLGNFAVRFKVNAGGPNEYCIIDNLTIKGVLISSISWSNPQVNQSLIYYGNNILFNTTWHSEYGLSGYIFSINQNGTWINSSFTPFGGNTNVSLSNVTITALPGTIVQWYFWANDSSGKISQTDIHNFTVKIINLTDGQTENGVSVSEALVLYEEKKRIWKVNISSDVPQVDVYSWTNYSKYNVSDDWTYIVNKTYMGDTTVVTFSVIKDSDNDVLYLPKTNLSDVVFTITATEPVLPNSTPIIFIGGIVDFVNDTYDADFTFSFLDYPYVKVNTTNKFDFKYSYNGSMITDAKIYFNILNFSQLLSYSPIYDSYGVWLFFNKSESGDYAWSASASRMGYTNETLGGTLIVRDYVKVKVRLWKDCSWYEFWCGWFNPDNQKNYKNRFGYVFATPVPDISVDRMAHSNYSWRRQLQPLADLAVWGNKKFLDNVTGLYKIPNKAFSAVYDNGQAVLFLPANETYSIEFMAGKMAWDNLGGYGEGYYSKKYTEIVFLDGLKTVSGLDYNLDYAITDYDLHKSQIWLFWIVFGTFIFLLLIFAGFVIAFDPAKGVIMLMIVLLLSPLIWLILKIIFWVIYM